MTFEEALQLVARWEAINAKEAEVLHLMLATTQGLASGEMVVTDPELKAVATSGEMMGLQLLGRTAASVEEFTWKAVEYAGRPGGEPMAEALRRQADTAAALRSCVEEFVAFMRRVGSMAGTEEAGRPAAARSRRRNAKYFGPEWSN